MNRAPTQIHPHLPIPNQKRSHSSTLSQKSHSSTSSQSESHSPTLTCAQLKKVLISYSTNTRPTKKLRLIRIHSHSPIPNITQPKKHSNYLHLPKQGQKHSQLHPQPPKKVTSSSNNQYSRRSVQLHQT